MTRSARLAIGLAFDLNAPLPGAGAYCFAAPVEGSVFRRYLPDAHDDAFVILGRVASPPFYVAWSDFLDFDGDGPRWLHLRRYNGFDEIRQYLAARIRIERRLSVSQVRAELARLKEESEGPGLDPDERAGLGNMIRHFRATLARLLAATRSLVASPAPESGPAILAAGGQTALHAPLN